MRSSWDNNLTNVVDWSWWIITLPLWIGLAFVLGVLLIVFICCLIVFISYLICFIGYFIYILIKWILGG